MHVAGGNSGVGVFITFCRKASDLTSNQVIVCCCDCCVCALYVWLMALAHAQLTVILPVTLEELNLDGVISSPQPLIIHCSRQDGQTCGGDF